MHKYTPNTQQQPPPQQQQGYAQTAPAAWLPPPPTAGPVVGGGGAGAAGGVASWETNYVSALSFVVKLLVDRISRILRPLGIFFGANLALPNLALFSEQDPPDFFWYFYAQPYMLVIR